MTTAEQPHQTFVQEGSELSPTAEAHTTTTATLSPTADAHTTTTATLSPTADAHTTTAATEGGADAGTVILADEDSTASTAAAAANSTPAPTEHPYEITRLINKTMLNELIEMGFEKIRAEKALFLSQNKSLEDAIQWIDDHSADPDIDEVLMLVSSTGDELPTKSTLTAEEAAVKAHDLQKQLRESRIRREKEEAREREKNRIASTKASQELQRKLEESQKKRAIEERERENAARQEERDRQQELLKREWEARFGRPYEERKEAVIDDTEQKPGKAQIVKWVNVMKKEYAATDAAGLKSCFTLMSTYIKNAHDNPHEMKYRRIRMSNKAFETRVAPYTGAVELLKAVGFKSDESGEALEIVGMPDGFMLGQGLKFVRLVADQL